MSKKQVATYILDKRIGNGAYAAVWRGHVRDTNNIVAIKVVKRNCATDVSRLRDEVAALRRVSHLNIVGYHDLQKTARHFYLVLEHCPDGDLYGFLRENGRVPEERARLFLADIVAGLNALHEAGVLHLDLQPSNILCTRGAGDGRVLKLSNLGFARALQNCTSLAAIQASRRPPVYMAPELLCGMQFDERADCWSAGVVLYEMLTGKTPFHGATVDQLLRSMYPLHSSETPPLALEETPMSEKAQELLHSLLVWSPERRLSSHDFAQHSYVDVRQYQSLSSVFFRSPPWAGHVAAHFRKATSAAVSRAVSIVSSLASLTAIGLRVGPSRRLELTSSRALQSPILSVSPFRAWPLLFLPLLREQARMATPSSLEGTLPSDTARQSHPGTLYVLGVFLPTIISRRLLSLATPSSNCIAVAGEGQVAES